MSQKVTLMLSNECIKQVGELAGEWGLPEQRHIAAVIERCVWMVYQFWFLTEKLQRAWKKEHWKD